MAIKEDLLQVKITKKGKAQIIAAAKAQDLKMAAYVLQGLDFYSTFDIHFLEQINVTAEKLKLPLPIVIQSLLQAYIAGESAMLDTYGHEPKIFARAFQFDEKGLIMGNKLSHLVYDQTKVDAEALKEKLTAAVEDGLPVRISNEESVFLAARL